MRQPLLGACIAAAVSACDAASVLRPDERPRIISVGIAANQHNVLSAIADVSAEHSDSVVVEYRLADATSPMRHRTPAVTFAGARATIPVLGLEANSRYLMQVVAYGDRRSTRGESIDFTTGSLPPDLPRYLAGGTDPSPGYVLFSAGAYALVINNVGDVVWYRRFTPGAGLNFMAQPTGRYVLRPPTEDPSDIEPWLELDALGNVTRTLTCAGGLPSRLHDLILEEDGSWWILCDETRTMNLASLGGVDGARVTGTVVQHVAADGTALFQWSPFDHFAITDVEMAERRGQNVNWTHGNAIDLDAEGNIYVSFRNLGEVTKIDGHTGEVVWRLGGLRNQFTFVDTPAPAFSRQHSARVGADGRLLLLDNVGNPLESRAERFVIDAQNRVAHLERSLGSVPRVVTQIGGSVQPLPGGRMLVSFGTAGRVEEYDALGRVMWRVEGNPGYVFRAQRIISLYTPGIGSAR